MATDDTAPPKIDVKESYLLELLYFFNKKFRRGGRYGFIRRTRNNEYLVKIRKGLKGIEKDMTMSHEMGHISPKSGKVIHGEYVPHLYSAVCLYGKGYSFEEIGNSIEKMEGSEEVMGEFAKLVASFDMEGKSREEVSKRMLNYVRGWYIV